VADEVLCGALAPFERLSDEAAMLRKRLTAAIHAFDVRSPDVRTEDDRFILLLTLEDFLEFRRSRSAWQDIRSDDADLISSAERLLGRE